MVKRALLVATVIITGIAYAWSAGIQYTPPPSSGGGGTGTTNNFFASTRTIVLQGRFDVLLATVGFNPQSVAWTNDAYSTWTLTSIQGFITIPSSVAESQFNANIATAPFGNGSVATWTTIVNSSIVVNANQRISAPVGIGVTLFPNQTLSLVTPVAPSSGTAPGGPFGLMIVGSRNGP